jgi:uncharacterized membrane protein YphA (DoxX/SURF4 family)
MSTASPRSSPDPLNRTSMQTPLIDRVAPGWGDAILLLGRILIGGIIGGFLFLFVTGGGRYSLDRWWRSGG